MLQDRAADEPDPSIVFSDGFGFSASVHQLADSTVISVAGEIDLATVELLRQAFQVALQRRCRVVVDLAGTTFIDSSGIAALLQADRDLGRLPEALALRSVTENVRRVLEISGVDQLLTLLD